MRYLAVWSIIGILLGTSCAVLPTSYSNLPWGDVTEVHIRVAVYDSILKDYVDEITQPLNYTWRMDDYIYYLEPRVITRSDIMKRDTVLTNDLFDVFVIPGSGRPYVDALSSQWRTLITTFVDQGGGYLGICGGANLASRGFREKKGLNGILNHSTLGIANVYVNNQQDEEWMYLWKANWEHGLPPIHVLIPENKNPIIKDAAGEIRNIRYGGGPGMYMAPDDTGKQGPVIPLAIYAEEPMRVAPLHYWIWDQGWKIRKNVTTDIQGQYAAIATSYGQGKIVLFGPHPEKKTFFGGYIKEFPVRPNMGPFTWHIYNWSNGTSSPGDYNWWMIQRATAWVSQKVPDQHLPPREDTYL